MRLMLVNTLILFLLMSCSTTKTNNSSNQYNAAEMASSHYQEPNNQAMETASKMISY